MMRTNRSHYYTQRGLRGYTLVELMVVLTLMSLLGVLFAGFVINSSKSIARISTQAELNNSASHAAMLIVRRTRAARLVEVSEDGDTLTLTFDDDVDVDTDEDGDFYNDTDHVEIFAFYNTDGELSTYEDNGIRYQRTADGDAQDLVTNVKKMVDTAVFAVSEEDDRKVDVSFELNQSVTSGPSQRVDIVTSAYCLNAAGGGGVAGPSGPRGDIGGGSGSDGDDGDDEEPNVDVEAAKEKLAKAEEKLQKELEKLAEELEKLAKEVKKLQEAESENDKKKAQEKVDKQQEKVNEKQEKVDKEQEKVEQAQKELQEAQA